MSDVTSGPVQSSVSAPANTGSVGSFSVSLTGADNAGNSTITSCPYTVVKAATTTQLASSLNPSTQGQSVTFTATVSIKGPGAGSISGSVTFMDGTTTLGSGTISTTNGVSTATFSTSILAAGPHTITAAYSGDASFSSSSGSATQTVSQASTTTTLASSANPSTSGQTVTFTTTVTASIGTPTGWVSFSYQNNGTTVVGFAPLVNGVASFSTSSLSAGTHTVTATYAGTSLFATSNGSMSQQVS